MNPTARHRASAWPRRARAARAARVCLAAALFFLPASLPAQQLGTDDAGIVGYRACQLEAWHGQRISWLLPACSPARNLELSVGVGWLANRPGGRDTDVLLEAKRLFRTLEDGQRAWGVVAGTLFEASARPGRQRFAGMYVYAPYTAQFSYDRLYLHGNLGWDWRRERAVAPTGAEHAMSWGARGDFVLWPRLMAVGEVFGTTRRANPEYQAGAHLRLVRDRLAMEITWGGHTERRLRGAGWTAGLAWTPPPFSRARPRK